jgi:hypothetical protein
MIPFGLTSEQFSHRLRRSLNGLSNKSIQSVRGLLNEPILDAVRCIEFQVFVDADNYGSPSIWLYFVGDNMKSSEISRELPLNLDELEEVDERYFTSFDFGGVSMMANALKTWFAESWWKAGGWDYGVPVVLDVHDGYGDGQKIQLTELV